MGTTNFSNSTSRVSATPCYAPDFGLNSRLRELEVLYGPLIPHTLAVTPVVYLALVLALGILAQWLAWRLKLPSILILLAFGFGLSITTGAQIDAYLGGETDTLLAVVSLFVAVILFEGGLTLKFSELKQAGVLLPPWSWRSEIHYGV